MHTPLGYIREAFTLALAMFMASPFGRGLRIVLGIALIVFGFAVGGFGGWAVAAFGLLPLATGAFNLCPISPFLGAPFRGSCLRR